jgi:hypothetical protein
MTFALVIECGKQKNRKYPKSWAAGAREEDIFCEIHTNMCSLTHAMFLAGRLMTLLLRKPTWQRVYRCALSVSIRYK